METNTTDQPIKDVVILSARILPEISSFHLAMARPLVLFLLCITCVVTEVRGEMPDTLQINPPSPQPSLPRLIERLYIGLTEEDRAILAETIERLYLSPIDINSATT